MASHEACTLGIYVLKMVVTQLCSFHQKECHLSIQITNPICVISTCQWSVPVIFSPTPPPPLQTMGLLRNFFLAGKEGFASFHESGLKVLLESRYPILMSHLWFFFDPVRNMSFLETRDFPCFGGFIKEKAFSSSMGHFLWVTPTLSALDTKNYWQIFKEQKKRVFVSISAFEKVFNLMTLLIFI